jgi:hypothetical protein
MGNETDSEHAAGSERRFSRRTLIKGGAVVGGALWVAPVVESFTSKAWAASVSHFCCSCSNPVQAGVDPNQGLADGHPPTRDACIAFCDGSAPGQSNQYQNFTWCGPSPVPLTYTASGFGPGAGPGCYLPSGAPDTGCVSGTISYGSPASTHTVTNSKASGAH